MKCGKCRETGVTLVHVRNCYGLGRAATVTKEDTLPTGNPQWDGRPANHHDASGASTREDNPWPALEKLRARAAKLLVRPERDYRIAYFALKPDPAGPVVKFYRAKYMTRGRWMGRFFLDAKGGPEYYPVKNPATLTTVLTKFLEDPEAAFHLYADKLGCCSRCNRDLTDDTSRALAMGPECRKK